MRPKLAATGLSLMLSALFLGLSTSSAHAYLDPGTGSMILQLLLGGFAGLALAGKLYWHRLLVFIGVRKESRRSKTEARADR
jgi:hypothetical protein